MRNSRITSRESRVISFLLFFFALSPALKAQEDAGAQFKVDVRLVNVFVTVTNDKGAPIGGLEKRNFRLFEDGREQEIRIFQRESALPLSIALEIDTSLSTRKDLKLELDAAKRFVHATVRPATDKLSIYTISENVDQLTGYTGELKRIDGAITGIHSGAATALFDGLYLGSEGLKERKGRKVIVLITDGGDTMSRTSYQEALRSALEAEAIVYSIIVVPIESNAGRNTGGEHALIQASEDTGGKYYYAKDIAQIDTAFRQVSDELRTQYLLAYYPSRRLSDSDFRRIEIKLVDSPVEQSWMARYRSGYYTH
jgi:Ca-activated chloride channel family protein